MCEDAMEFRGQGTRAPAQKELKIAERVVAYNSYEMNMLFVLMSVRKSVASRNLITAVLVRIVQVSPKRHPQRVTSLLKAYLVLVYNQ